MTLLLDSPDAEGQIGSSLAEAARYLVTVGGPQLASVAAAATQLLGQGGGSFVPDAGLDSENAEIGLGMSGALLGLSPWRMASGQESPHGMFWGITAGVSLTVALAGYWYCQEYIARQRQVIQPRRQPARALVGSLSGLDRDELV
jgi:hypothetical protein